LKNLDHRVARSTVAKTLKDNGIPPAPARSSSWRTFLRAHWGAIAGADFFTTEVWTARGLVTYYTLFVLDLRSRRVQIVGSTLHPDAAFMTQAARRLTDAVDGFLAGHRVLICDRDAKWTDGFRALLDGAGVRIVMTPVQAPNANAYAERFVRSIREECLDRLILVGERRLLNALKEFMVHYHEERNHQGHWISARRCHDDGKRARRILGGNARWSRAGDDNIDVEAHKITSEFFGTLGPPVVPTRFERDVPILNVSEISHTLPKRVDDYCWQRIGRSATRRKYSDPPYLFGLLRLGTERRGEHGSQANDKYAPIHSIT
jgi:hypothetical protein